MHQLIEGDCLKIMKGALDMDQLGELMSNYAELRRFVIDSAPGSYTKEPLTHEQRMVALHDGVPAKPDRRLYTEEEYEQKLAEYNSKIGYKLSPLGGHGAHQRERRPVLAQHDPDFADYLARRRAENELDPEYGILRRMAEERPVEP